MKFARIILNSKNMHETNGFYTDLLGMSPQTHGLGYGPGEAHIGFVQGPVEVSANNHFFWKLGITLGNLDHAVAYLRSRGVVVSNPRQFQEIGYLAHITDPSGNIIELLQKGFEGNHAEPVIGHPIGAQAILAHITLRVRDILAAKIWAQKHSLRLMSVQHVNSHGFTLYFYAWSTEILPNPDHEAVENREWLWARPYTILELQHLHGSHPDRLLFFNNIKICVADNDILKALELNGLQE